MSTRENNLPKSGILKNFPDRLVSNGNVFLFCVTHRIYHTLKEISCNCFPLSHVARLPWYVKEPKMKKPDSPTIRKDMSLELRDEQFIKKFPTVYEYLVTSKWDDGSERESSTLSVFVEDGMLKIALNDRDQHRSLYVSAETLQGALAALEKAVSGSMPEWRSWGKRGKKGK